MFNHVDGSTFEALGFRRKPEIVSAIASAAQLAVSHYDADLSIDLDEFANSLFHELLDAGAIIKEGDYFAGEFYHFIQQRYHSFRTEALEASEPNKLAQRIGKSFYPAVFNNFRNKPISSYV